MTTNYYCGWSHIAGDSKEIWMRWKTFVIAGFKILFCHTAPLTTHTSHEVWMFIWEALINPLIKNIDVSDQFKWRFMFEVPSLVSSASCNLTWASSPSQPQLEDFYTKAKAKQSTIGVYLSDFFLLHLLYTCIDVANYKESTDL